MNNSKKIAAGLMAFSMVAGLSACGNSNSGNETTTETTVETTTAKTVAVNTEALKEDEQTVLEDLMTQLQDVELENKEVKWMAHYDINPSTNGASKSVGLEMFEQKYGGKITYVPTTWDARYTDLAKAVSAGDGIDIFPGDDTSNFPNGVVNGMFQPVDDYIDLNSELWQNMAPAMELLNFGGKHFAFVTSVTAEQVVIYNTQTLEENGLDDPWDLYKEGNWNWGTFKQMLLDFVDVENEQYGLDGYWAEKALYLSAGKPTVESVNGSLVCNLKDATVEKAMNFQYDLFTNGLVFDRSELGNHEQPQMMGSGNQLFFIVGAWHVRSDPETWATEIDPEKLGIAPVPSPEGSDPYQSATLGGYALCKGAQNPQGAALFAECQLLGSLDERAIAISDRKLKDDCKWSDDIIAREKEINELARQYPVLDLATGTSSEVKRYTTDGGDNVGTRAALHGTDWATTRETYADAVIMLVEEVDAELQKKIAEG